MNKIPWQLALLVPPVVKGWVYPGWSSVLELVVFCSLAGVLMWVSQQKSPEAAKLAELEESLHRLDQQHKTLMAKIGFRTGG